MNLRVISLASGSSGNALLIQTASSALLVDCGLPQRTVEKALRRFGMEPHDLAAIVLTHEHGDHAHSAGPLARRYGLPVIANAPTVAALGETLDHVAVHEIGVGDVVSVDGYAIRSFAVPHDAAAPVGYAISACGWCVGVAIDLGSWDATVVEGLREADLVVVEANHDRERLRNAPYNWSVKQRIFSPLGHLDNVATGELLARLGADGRKRTAWLAHLSEQANSPQIAHRIVGNVLSMARVGCIGLHALPRRDTLVWECERHMAQATLW